MRHLPRALQSVAVALALAACAAPAGTAATSAPAASTAPTSAPATQAPTATPVAAVNSGPALPVLGTENFYADLLKQIGGSRVAAESLLNDPNADPHEFEASPKAAQAVADAQRASRNASGDADFK